MRALTGRASPLVRDIDFAQDTVRVIQRTVGPVGARGIADQIIAGGGAAPPGFVGGGAFANHEGLLPPGGVYREYDVRLHTPGVNRGPERIVMDAANNVWYTNDHYHSFNPI